MANVFCLHYTKIKFASWHHSQCYSLCLATQVHTCMALLKAVHYEQTNITLPAEIQHALCLLVQRTHTTPPLFSFGRPVLWMFYFQSTELGHKWTWSTPCNATSCHIFFLRMDNKFAKENFTEILRIVLPPHGLCIRNAFRTVMSVRWKTVSWSTSTFCGQSRSCWPFCLTCPQTPCMHCSLLLNEVW